MSEPTAIGLRVSTEAATTPAGAAVAVAAFEGDLDLATISEFEDAVREAGDAALVVDLSEVRFIDSSGIHSVMRARQSLAERGLRLELVVAPGSAVERVLEISSLSDELRPKTDCDAALAALDNATGP